MTPQTSTFTEQFQALTGFLPLAWQTRLFDRLARGDIPWALDLPTGLGKTSVMAIWLIARTRGAKLPRRLVYIVDRRAVVDQATAEAERLGRSAKSALGIEALPVSTLRGALVDNREWLADPAAPAIIVGTVDMIGSRLLFSGYGVSPKMRPYHAGLLATDALVVLDEAHLIPPFAHLLRAIEQNPTFWPRSEADRALLPRTALLPLSATQREGAGKTSERSPFVLEEEDWKTDCVTQKRVWAKKCLFLKPLASKDQDQQLAAAALALATKSGTPLRIAVFCDRREKGDEGAGPSAQGVASAIEDLAKRQKVAIHPPELLAGARRVYERDAVAKRLAGLGFIGEKKPLERPAFLVATSAGEVGIDLDADHMVSDLTAWERMVQRLGRVNRRGERDAEITVFWSNPSMKDPSHPTERERRLLTASGSKAVIEELPRIGAGFDGSPGALRTLVQRGQDNAELKVLIDAATTEETLRPALTRAVVDAWSMTSLKQHTGRPDVAPWLRGWAEDAPQTTVVWRSHLPLRVDIPDWPRTRREASEIEDFFEAAPPHESERLQTEAYRVADWLQKRARALRAAKRPPEEAAPDKETTEDENKAVSPAKALNRDDVVVMILSASGGYLRRCSLGDLEQERKGDLKTDFEKFLAGKLLVVDGRFGGLKDGLLEPGANEEVKTADTLAEWQTTVEFRVLRIQAPDAPPTEEWRFESDFVVRRSSDGDPLEWLRVEHLKEGARKEDARSISRPQELAQHQDWTKSKMLRITERLGLPDHVAKALAVAASLHDEGKKATRWQTAFKASRDARRCGLSVPLAKTLGPIDQALLDGYRHEFGSLPCVENSADFTALPGEWHDLILHLVAAHHGFARPIIETRACEDAPPSALEARARGVALRYARLQKQWGPWGLAWWEALLRAADTQASRDNDQGYKPSDPEPY